MEKIEKVANHRPEIDVRCIDCAAIRRELYGLQGNKSSPIDVFSMQFQWYLSSKVC